MLGGGVVQNMVLFLIQALLSIYIFALLVRALLTLAAADFYNPISQFLVRFTNPPLIWLRKFIPSFNRVDLSCWLFAYIVKLTQLMLIILLQGYETPLQPLLIVGLIQLTETVLNVYIFALIILAISSWFMTGSQYYNPAMALIYTLVAPLLNPLRRRLPSTGPFDFSVMVLLLLLYLLQVVLHSLY